MPKRVECYVIEEAFYVNGRANNWLLWISKYDNDTQWFMCKDVIRLFSINVSSVVSVSLFKVYENEGNTFSLYLGNYQNTRRHVLEYRNLI